MSAQGVQPKSAPRRRTALVWVSAGLAALVVLVVAVLLAADTPSGHRTLRQALPRLGLESGLQVRIGKIDGSIYGRMVLHDLELRDPQGVFLTSPAVTVDWRPAAFLFRNHLDLREISSAEIRVLRRPQLKPTPRRDRTLLPSFDISLGRLALDRLILEPPVTGRRQLATVSGALQVRRGRLQSNLLATSRARDGVGGGDMISLRLDARPDANQLLVDARVSAPKGGVIAGLAGLEHQLEGEVIGEGTWASWTGRAVVRLGEEDLAQLGLAARDGHFAVRGDIRPAILLTGSSKRLLQPRVVVDLAATLAKGRRVDARLRLNSAALAVTAQGRLDFRQSRFGDLRLRADLLQPSALSEALAGQSVRLSARLDGPFSAPDVRYELAASQLAFGQTRLEALTADGRFRVRADRTSIPVHARVARVVGLGEAVTSVARDMRIDGEVVVTADQIATDNLHLRADHLNATLVASVSLATGRYAAALKGALNRFEQPGIGIFDFVTDAHLAGSRDGALSLRGRVEARSRRIDNSGLRDLLGGQLTADTAFERSGSGTFTLSGLHLTAPRLRLANGRGRISAEGRLDFTAVAQSQRYGPVELAATGSLQDPVLRLKADNPRLAVPVTGLQVVIKRGAGGYLVTATGASPYGPLAAEAALGLGGGALTLDIADASLAGIRLSGGLRQTQAGPFAGELRISGSGLNGTLRLSASGRTQRVDAQVQARNARLPLSTPVLIAAGVAQGSAILYPDKPALNAQARLRGVRRDQVAVEQATAQLAYGNGRGTLDLTAQGSGGAPFSLLVRAALSHDVVVANAKGSIGRTTLRLQNPAQLRRTNGGWRLRPTTVLLEEGRVELAGEFGAATSLKATLRAVDLGLSRAVAPQLGLDGVASGEIAVGFPGGDVPEVRANLQVKGLGRNGPVSTGVPVDLAIVGELSSAGGQASGLIRRRGEVIGRIKAQIGAAPAGAQAWTERLGRAALSGGIRYNGPANVPWSLTGVTGQTLTGPLALGADFSGRLADPELTGVLRAKGLRYTNTEFGTVVSDLDLDGRLVGSRVQLSRLSGRAGAGAISGRGYVDLSADRGFPMDLRLSLKRAEIADSDALGAVLTGDIALTNSRERGAVVSGRTSVEQAHYRIARRGAAEVPELTGVRRGPLATSSTGAAAASGRTSGFPSAWRLNVAVEGDNRIFVSGMGLDSEWQTSLRIRGTASDPRIIGEARAVRGGYSFAGRRFELSRGVIRFNGGSAIDPSIDILATTTAEGIGASISVTGRAANPQITFSSTPPLPQDEVLARMLFGNSTAELSAGQALQLAASLNALRGSGGANPLMSLRQATGVDRLRFLGADESGGRGPSIAAGKYISNDVYVEVTTDARGFTAVQIEVALSKSLSLLSQAGSLGNTNLNLRYRRDY